MLTADFKSGLKFVTDRTLVIQSFKTQSIQFIEVLLIDFITVLYYLDLFKSSFGILTMQMFIDLLSSDSMADWISISVPSGLNVG